MSCIKKFSKWLLAMSCCIFLGSVLMISIYSLPTGKIKEHIALSSNIFDIEGAYPSLVPGFISTQLDNFTDSIMLGNAMYNGEEATAIKAMSNYRMYSEKLGIIKSTTHYANDVEADYFAKPYERYWHGYLIILKPLLAFFSYGEIRILNWLLQSTLLIYLFRLLLTSPLKQYVYVYIITILFLNPAVIYLSLQYSTIYYIFLFEIIVWLTLLRYDRLTTQCISNLYFLTGSITSFFDLLTYPLLTLGTLCVLSVQTYGNDEKHVKLVIKNTMLWGYGYIGMWMGKWMIGSIILKKNLFLDAYSQFLLRSSSRDSFLNRFYAIESNFQIFSHKVFLIFCLIIGTLVMLISCRKVNLTKNCNIRIVVCYITISLMPFLWFLVTANHSYIHAWFTHRTISIAVFSIGSLLTHINYSNRTIHKRGFSSFTNLYRNILF